MTIFRDVVFGMVGCCLAYSLWRLGFHMGWMQCIRVIKGADRED